MFVRINDDTWVNPDHVELVYTNSAQAVVVMLRSGKRFLIYGKTADEVVQMLGGMG